MESSRDCELLSVGSYIKEKEVSIKKRGKLESKGTQAPLLMTSFYLEC